MAEFPALPLWTDAYLGDTTHLTTIEHGAYLLLLMSMWRSTDCALPDDDRLLARYARLTPAQWRRIKPVIMPFFRVAEGRVTQGRLTDERNVVRQHSKLQSNKAKRRWLKTNDSSDAAAMPRECPHTHTHTQEEEKAAAGPSNPPAREGFAPAFAKAETGAETSRSERVRRAAGIDIDKSLPVAWCDHYVIPAIDRWCAAGLSLDDVIHLVAGKTPARGGAPPRSPAYFDGIMRDAAQQKRNRGEAPGKVSIGAFGTAPVFR